MFIEVIEMIGGDDASSGNFQLHSFDNSGGIVKMRGELKDGVMHIYNEKARAELQQLSLNHLRASWDKLSDTNHWTPWMHLELTRSE